MPSKSKITSIRGDQTAKITVGDLMQRLEIMNVATLSKMGETLNLDVEELMAILDRLAAAIPRDKYETTRQSLRGVLSWGVAIGYFYAKQSKPLIVQ